MNLAPSQTNLLNPRDATMNNPQYSFILLHGDCSTLPSTSYCKFKLSPRISANMSELRQRRGARQRQQQQPTAFANIAADDAALQPEAPPAPSRPSSGLTTFGRMSLFIAFPFLVGLAGLYVGYLRSFADPTRKIDLDSDFIFPFLLALTMVLVIGFQTSGFTTSDVKPVVVWPKVKRRKKVIHKRVIVDDEEEEEK